MELQKTTQDENCQTENFFYLKCLILLRDSRTIIFQKTEKCPGKITFLHKFLYKGQNMSPDYYLITLLNVISFKAHVFFNASNQQNIMITTEKKWRDRKSVPVIKNFAQTWVKNLCHNFNQFMPSKEKLMIDL